MKTPEEKRAYNREYYHRVRKHSPLRIKRNKLRAKEWYYRKTYGLSYEWFVKQSNKQKNKCAICGHKPRASHGKLAVDHCHKTGQVRGLVCGRCNLAIGLIDDNWETAMKMAKYLK